MDDKFHLSVVENVFLAKKILVSNIYNAAKLEGVNTTFPETEAILGGVNVPGARLSDIQVILNLRDAWRYLIDNVETVEVDLEFVKKLNGYVSRNESLAWGEVRTGKVGIAGTDYKPEVPVEEDVARGVAKIVGGGEASATERAIDLFLFIVKSQVFWDGNKRTATLAANAMLIKNGAGILSVSDRNIVRFNELLKGYYDTGDRGEIRRFLYDKAVINFGSDLGAGDGDVSLNVPSKVPLNETDLAVLREISENPYATADEIAERIGKTRKTVQRAEAELRGRGMMCRVGSKKSGYWEISPEG